MKITIVSGGQTGADRAALAWAMRHDIPYAGWCPKGRWSENGPIPPRYRLKETPSPATEERTLWNVRDSDGTAILSVEEKLREGTAQTAKFCMELGKPMIALSAAIWTSREAGMALAHFVTKHHVRILNVAGPRASEEAEVARFTRAVLSAAFARPVRRKHASA